MKSNSLLIADMETLCLSDLHCPAALSALALQRLQQDRFFALTYICTVVTSNSNIVPPAMEERSADMREASDPPCMHDLIITDPN